MRYLYWDVETTSIDQVFVSQDQSRIAIVQKDSSVSIWDYPFEQAYQTDLFDGTGFFDRPSGISIDNNILFFHSDYYSYGIDIDDKQLYQAYIGEFFYFFDKILAGRKGEYLYVVSTWEIFQIDARTLNVTGHIKAHDNLIKDIAISHTGEYLVTASTGKELKVWSLPGLQFVKAYKDVPEDLNALQFINENVFLGADQANQIHAWPLNDNQKIGTMEVMEEVRCILPMPNSGKLLLGTSDGFYETSSWGNTSARKFIHFWQLKSVSTQIYDMATNIEESLFLTGGFDGAVVLWQADPIKQLGKLIAQS